MTARITPISAIFVATTRYCPTALSHRPLLVCIPAQICQVRKRQIDPLPENRRGARDRLRQVLPGLRRVLGFCTVRACTPHPVDGVLLTLGIVLHLPCVAGSWNQSETWSHSYRPPTRCTRGGPGEFDRPPNPLPAVRASARCRIRLDTSRQRTNCTSRIVRGGFRRSKTVRSRPGVP